MSVLKSYRSSRYRSEDYPVIGWAPISHNQVKIAEKTVSQILDSEILFFRLQIYHEAISHPSPPLLCFHLCLHSLDRHSS